MCEKTLAHNKFACLRKDTLTDSTKIAAGTRLAVELYNTASTCIEYCKGLNHQYALATEKACECAEAIKFNATFGDPSWKLDPMECPMYRASQNLGTDVRSVALYHTGLALPGDAAKDKLQLADERLGSATCHELAYELNVMPPGVQWAQLQHQLHDPIVRTNCDRAHVGLCLRNVLQYLPPENFELIGSEEGVDRPVGNLQTTFEFTRQAFQFKLCKDIFHNNKGYAGVGHVHYLCRSNVTLIQNVDEGALDENLTIRITFPEEQILVGWKVFRELEEFQRATLKTIGKVSYQLPSYFSNRAVELDTSGVEFPKDLNGAGQRDVMFFKTKNGRPLQIVTKTIEFSELKIESKLITNYTDPWLVLTVAVQMALFGCPAKSESEVKKSKQIHVPRSS